MIQQLIPMDLNLSTMIPPYPHPKTRQTPARERCARTVRQIHPRKSAIRPLPVRPPTMRLRIPPAAAARTGGVVAAAATERSGKIKLPSRLIHPTSLPTSTKK